MSRVNGDGLTLSQARCEFALAISQLLVWANEHLVGYRVAFGEGLVAVTDAADGDYDGPHVKGGAHYNGLGMDLLIYDDAGRFVANGEAACYRTLGEQWRHMHWLAKWGGDFKSPDWDHFSFTWEGAA